MLQVPQCRTPLKGLPRKQLWIPKRRSPMIRRVQSLARHHAPELRLQDRFDGLEDESMELTYTDPSPENSQPAPSQTRTNNEDGPLTSDQTINDESLGASPSTAHVLGKDIHATLVHCDFKLAVTRKSRPCRGTLRVLIKQIAA